MKRIYNFMLLFLASAALVLTGCKKEEIVFDHEQPQFETKADAILLEVIMPNGTASDEQLFITGAFNGGEKYQLDKAEKSDKKWGIYLYESDFAEGKSLKDGFYFVSATNGAERSAKGDTIVHTLDVAFGTRTNVWVASWEAFFKSGDEPVPGKYEHLYLLGNIAGIGWVPDAPLEMTMVGTDIFSSEVTFEGEGTCYFAIATEKGSWDVVNAARWGSNGATLTEGAALDLISDGTEQTVTIAPGTYTITVNMVANKIVIGEWKEDPNQWPTYKHDGDAIYFCNNAEWADVRLYMWGDVNDLNGGWPGMEPTGTFQYKGYDWYYFDLGAANAGKTEHLIVNDNNGTQIDDVVVYELTEGDSIFYFMINPGKKAVRIDDPTTYEYPKQDDDPEDDPVVIVPDTITTRLYFLDATTGVKPNVYSWGNDDQGENQQIFGGWPGVNWTEWSKVTFLATDFYYYEFEAVEGQAINLIINGEGEGNQYNAFGFTVGEKTDIYLEIGDTEAHELVATPKGIRRK